MTRWKRQLTGIALALACAAGMAAPAGAQPPDRRKADRIVTERAGRPGTSRVIVRFRPGVDASKDLAAMGGRLGRALRVINARVVELPNVAIPAVTSHSAVLGVHHDRPAAAALNRVTAAVGASAAQARFGYTGAGVGVAVIDSGITGWHDDLGAEDWTSAALPAGQRVAGFVDFVNGRTIPYDDNGHGSHVAGIIGGNGYDSLGARAGIAPAASLVGLKVLDDRGRGVVSDVIAALDWVLLNRTAYNIRVVNLSVGAAVTESFRTDPLTLAARTVVDSGIVVVTAAGNLGKNAEGGTQYGGILAPGNAPWVITVGAYSHEGTISRHDDVIAGYSSRGPTAIDFAAKPDLVAPGTGVVSLSDPSSLLYYTKSAYLLKGSLVSSYLPYLSLTGTSMAAPVVSGTVALMLQANPSLTPNMVKAILQYTAERRPAYDPLTQGAGFINSYGAVHLARFYRTARRGDRLAVPSSWSRQIIWGNRRIGGGVIRPTANAFEPGTTWGALRDAQGDNIVWGTLFGRDGDNIVWGTSFDGDNIVWGTSFDRDNIVWGTSGDGAGDNIVWGTSFDGDNIVWGTSYEVDNIVWGTDCGGADCDNVVWGTIYDGAGDNIVWGTSFAGDNIVWGTAEWADNIVWGTDGLFDNIVWGTASDDGSGSWGTSAGEAVLFDEPEEPASSDESVWQEPVPAGSEGF